MARKQSDVIASRSRLSWLWDASHSALAWVLVALFGVIFLALQVFLELDEFWAIALFILGTLGTIIGGAGLGGALGVPQGEDRIRLKAEPPFRSTFRLYQGLDRLQQAASRGRESTISEADDEARVDLSLALAKYDQLLARIEEQFATVDDAYDEWEELLPDRVAELRRVADQRRRLKELK